MGQPGPGAVVRLVHAQWPLARRSRPRQGAVAARPTALPTPCATTRRSALAQNIAAHYDLGNDFYAAWLDQTMTYSSAVFADGDSLEEAQARKLRLLLDRLDLKPGQRLLEIGCGWGSLAEIAARDYGVQVVGLTLSTEQKAYADQRMAKAGLAGMVEIRLADYRELDERFDAVASVEMVEAVGQEYWADYLAAIGRCSVTRRPRGAPVDLDRSGFVRRLCAPTPTSSRPTSSPAEC